MTPVTELAHARVMAGDAAACSTMVMGHGMPGSMPHGPSHQHQANCCEFCPSGCVTVALPAAFQSIVALHATRHAADTGSDFGVIPGRPRYLLPFSIAPPSFSV
jgi:hypothetical protein